MPMVLTEWMPMVLTEWILFSWVVFFWCFDPGGSQTWASLSLSLTDGRADTTMPCDLKNKYLHLLGFDDNPFPIKKRSNKWWNVSSFIQKWQIKNATIWGGQQKPFRIWWQYCGQWYNCGIETDWNTIKLLNLLSNIAVSIFNCWTDALKSSKTLKHNGKKS